MKYKIHYNSNSSMEGGYKSDTTIPIQITIQADFVTGKQMDDEEVPTSSLGLVIPKPVCQVMISYLRDIKTWNENVFIENYSVEKIKKFQFKITTNGIKIKICFESSIPDSIDTNNEHEAIIGSIENWAEQSIWQTQYSIPKGKNWTDNQYIDGFNIIDIKNIKVDISSTR